METFSEYLRFDTGQGGLTRATLSTRASEAEIYLYGAQVTRFRRRGRLPVLFLSDRSSFQRGKAIRGGIPVVFPWFGARPEKPAHGFARIMDWSVVDSEASPEKASIVLSLSPNDVTRALWPHEFVITLRITIDDRLTLSLEVTNDSDGVLSFEEALHTYFAVDDVRHASVEGLEDTVFVDKTTDAMTRKRQGRAPLTVDGAIDRVFLNTMSSCTLRDPVLRRRISIDKSGARSTVIWNPHSEKAKAMNDLGDDGWQRMLCVETGNVGENMIHLEKKQRWIMTAVIREETDED